MKKALDAFSTASTWKLQSNQTDTQPALFLGYEIYKVDNLQSAGRRRDSSSKRNLYWQKHRPTLWILEQMSIRQVHYQSLISCNLWITSPDEKEWFISYLCRPGRRWECSALSLWTNFGRPDSTTRNSISRMCKLRLWGVGNITRPRAIFLKDWNLPFWN